MPQDAPCPPEKVLVLKKKLSKKRPSTLAVNKTKKVNLLACGSKGKNPKRKGVHTATPVSPDMTTSC